MNKAQADAIRIAVSTVFASLSATEIKDVVMSPYAELREELLVSIAA